MVAFNYTLSPAFHGKKLLEDHSITYDPLGKLMCCQGFLSGSVQGGETTFKGRDKGFPKRRIYVRIIPEK